MKPATNNHLLNDKNFCGFQHLRSKVKLVGTSFTGTW